jgi:hypothetical protein
MNSGRAACDHLPVRQWTSVEAAGSSKGHTLGYCMHAKELTMVHSGGLTSVNACCSSAGVCGTPCCC